MTKDPEAAGVDLVIRGGTLVTDAWSGPGTVLVSGGRIRDLLDAQAPLPQAAASARTIDATGRLVLPGGVDPHCHIAVPVGAYTTRDDYASSTLAALAGGTTTVIDFAIPLPGESATEAVAARHAMARHARCDYALHG
nr:amidohydrolase family protein [Lysobacter sp.]